MDCNGSNCVNIPWRHRDFVPAQLCQLEVWDNVMREMECQCFECSSHSSTGKFDFHLNNGKDLLCFETACHCCPCYSRESTMDEGDSDDSGDEPSCKKPRTSCSNKNCSSNNKNKTT